MRYIRELSFETQNLLKRISKFSKHYQTRDRAKCIILSNKGYTIEELIRIFDVHINTVYNWFNNWQKLGLLSLYNSPGQGCKPKINAENEAFIRESIEKFPKQLNHVISILEKKN